MYQTSPDGTSSEESHRNVDTIMIVKVENGAKSF